MVEQINEAESIEHFRPVETTTIITKQANGELDATHYIYFEANNC